MPQSSRFDHVTFANHAHKLINKFQNRCSVYQIHIEVYCRTAASPSNCQKDHIKAASENKLGTVAVSAAGLCGFVRCASATLMTWLDAVLCF